jgi:tripartite-type tricarboxylate transporter receptor subunit TctC
MCIALAAACVTPASAQTFPLKPIRIIVPYPAGGASDTLARQLSVAVSDKTGQPVVVDNKPGGATVIAAQALLHAPADGYTVAIFDPSTVSMNQYLFKKLAYDPATITPVTTLVKIQFGLMVASASPIKTLKEYVDAAKAKPNTITFGSSGAGNSVHLSMEQFKSVAGIDVTHVPYKGGAPALQDLIGGQIPSIMMDLTSAMPFIKAGQVRVLAVASPTRSEILPDVPTFAESGYSNFSAGSWFGLFVPQGTPAPVIVQLNTIFREAAATPKVTEWIKSVTLEPSSGTPSEFARLIKSDADSYGTTIRRLGFSMD